MKNMRRNDLLSIVLAVIVFAVIQVGIMFDFIGAFWEASLVLTGINVILAVSLNLINGFTGQFSIGHAGFMAVGAYGSAILTVKLGMPYVVALVGAMIAAGILGLAIGLPTLRLKGDYLAIATLGLGEIIRVAILNIQYVGGASGFMGIPRMTDFAVVFLMIVVTIFVVKNIINSAQGRACLAIRENEIAADVMGIDTTKYKVMAFTVGAAFAGLAGGLFSHYYYIAHPGSFTFLRSFDILTMVVLGGLGSITGSVLGAVLLTVISAFLSDYPEWRMIIYSILLIVMMLRRPQGLLGTREFNFNFMSNLSGGAKK